MSHRLRDNSDELDVYVTRIAGSSHGWRDRRYPRPTGGGAWPSKARGAARTSRAADSRVQSGPECRIVVPVGKEQWREPSPGSIKLEEVEPALLDEDAVDEALTLSDFDADIGKGAAADRSNGTFYASTEELIAGLSKLAEHSDS